MGKNQNPKKSNQSNPKNPWTKNQLISPSDRVREKNKIVRNFGGKLCGEKHRLCGNCAGLRNLSTYQIFRDCEQELPEKYRASDRVRQKKGNSAAFSREIMRQERSIVRQIMRFFES